MQDRDLEFGAASGNITWLPTEEAAVSCPNCGDPDGKKAVLRGHRPDPKVSGEAATLLLCNQCGCGFFHPFWTIESGLEQAANRAVLSFYLQQNAGIWSITSNIAALGRPDGTRFLEVGCGFGFGLDFARRSLGWTVLGVDPSPLAAIGREQLGVPIESRYLDADDPAFHDRFDVIMASEVIEHVPVPPDFARLLHGALRDGGELVLTTPDVEAVTPDTPDGLLLPLLSLGSHLVLQSRRSLETILRNAGFSDVAVHQSGGASLTARCRRGAASGPSAPADASRDLYRRYLGAAAEDAPAGSDLWFGLAARSYREAVNAGDRAVADRAWNLFSAACERRFGFAPEQVPPAADHPGRQTLAALAAREPVCLGPMLLHRAYHRLAAGESRPAIEPLFARAAEACGRLRSALRELGMEDGDAEDIGWVARAEELLCASERGAAGTAARFTALGPAPGDRSAGQSGRGPLTASYGRRMFVSLVNASLLDEAGALAAFATATGERAAQPGALLGNDELDVLFCAASRELRRPGGDAARALEWLGLLSTAAATARAAGNTASAVTLLPLAREAEMLARTKLL